MICAPPWRSLLVVLGALAWGMVSVHSVAAQQRPKVKLSVLQGNHADLHDHYVQELDELARFCSQNGLQDGIAEIRKYRAIPSGSAIKMVTLPSEFQPPLPAELTPEDREWQTKLRYEREKYATELYKLSRRALDSGYFGYAYDLIRELAQHHTDHEKARELLGYVAYEKRWVTPYARTMMLKGFIWNDQFGWIERKNEARYLNGERIVDGRWMSKEKEAEIRRDFRHAWEIKTDHYLIKTNHSLERGVELGRALEDFHEFFHQTFVGFFNEPEHLQKKFAGTTKSSSRIVDPFEVHFYHTREEYVARLKPHFPDIDKTNGIYLTTGPEGRTAHFYFDPDGNHEATLFHEATHQLFYESHLQHRPIADKANFWIIEGIACYMESFRRDNGEFSIGDPQYIRFVGAQANFINLKYYVPLQDFTAMGMQAFQTAPMLAKNYTQASGLALFFMHYDGGRYRDALMAHLADLYSNNARKRDFPRSLDELTGEPFSELDHQYGDYLHELAKGAIAAQVQP